MKLQISNISIKHTCSLALSVIVNSCFLLTPIVVSGADAMPVLVVVLGVRSRFCSLSDAVDGLSVVILLTLGLSSSTLSLSPVLMQ